MLVIGPGFGGGVTGSKFQYILAKGHVCELIDLPEPTAGDDEALEAGVSLLAESLQIGQRVDVVLAASRGGKYLAELRQRRLWTGPTFLISGLSTGRCCSASGAGPLMLCHGTRDSTNPIVRVRNDVAGCVSAAELVEFEDNHSLHSLVDGGEFEAILQRCITMPQVMPSASTPPGGLSARSPGRAGLFDELVRQRKPDVVVSLPPLSFIQSAFTSKSAYSASLGLLSTERP